MLKFHLGHRPALDGMRGVAVLLVTAYHLGVPFFENGFVGVDVFFTLSGFLITSLLLEEWLQTGQIHLKYFYIRRLLRLYPALLWMLLLVGPISRAYPYILSTLTYTTNWVLALYLQPMNPEFSHTWSLAIEEQYYLLWPIALLFLAKKPTLQRLVLIPITLAFLSAIARILYAYAGQGFWRLYAGTDAHMDGLLLGSALGAATFFGVLKAPKTIRWISWGAGIGTILLCGAFLFNPAVEYTKVVVVGPLLAALLSCLLIYSVTFDPQTWIVKILSSRVLVFFGVISYGLYLWQMPVIQFVKLDAYSVSPGLQGLAQFVLMLLLTLFSYQWIEKPIRRLNKRFAAPHNQPPAHLNA